MKHKHVRLKIKHRYTKTIAAVDIYFEGDSIKLYNQMFENALEGCMFKIGCKNINLVDIELKDKTPGPF